MKGLELPINMIIVIAVAVLVLVVIAAYFSVSVSGGTLKTDLQASWNSFCGTQAVTGCSDWNSGSGSTTIQGKPYSMVEICKQLYGQTLEEPACKKKCCPNAL